MSSNLWGFVIISSLIVRCEGGPLLAVSNNAVYNGERLNLTCIFGDGVVLNVTMDAFNQTYSTGFLSCDTQRHKTTSAGVFSGHSFDVCSLRLYRPTNITVSMTASPSLELFFSCTVAEILDDKVVRRTSSTVFVVVNERPEKPYILPNPTVYKYNVNATLMCYARAGKPIPAVTLSVISRDGNILAVNGNGSTSLMLPLPLTNWHQANASCSVTNHNFSQMTASDVIMINHITCINGPAVFQEDATETELDCLKYISGYPIDSYVWSVPPEVNVSDSSLLGRPIFTVLPGQSATLNCTATNNVINESVTIIFAVGVTKASTFSATIGTRSMVCYSSSNSPLEKHVDIKYWIFGPIFVVFMAIVGGIVAAVYWRRRFRHREESHMTENDFYVGLSIQSTVSDAVYDEIDLGDHLATPRFPVHDGIYAKIIRKRDTSHQFEKSTSAAVDSVMTTNVLHV